MHQTRIMSTTNAKHFSINKAELHSFRQIFLLNDDVGWLYSSFSPTLIQLVTIKNTSNKLKNFTFNVEQNHNKPPQPVGCVMTYF